MSAIKLSRADKDIYLNDVMHGFQINQTLNKFGLDRLGMVRYLETDPEFETEIAWARLKSARFLENDMINVHKTCNGDHKLARIRQDGIVKLLGYIDPKVYGTKIDMNVNQNVSLRLNIESANERVLELMRDVTLVVPKLKNPA